MKYFLILMFSLVLVGLFNGCVTQNTSNNIIDINTISNTPDLTKSINNNQTEISLKPCVSQECILLEKNILVLTNYVNAFFDISQNSSCNDLVVNYESQLEEFQNNTLFQINSFKKYSLNDADEKYLANTYLLFILSDINSNVKKYTERLINCIELIESCNDYDICTTDGYNDLTKVCVHNNIIPCCGN